ERLQECRLQGDSEANHILLALGGGASAAGGTTRTRDPVGGSFSPRGPGRRHLDRAREPPKVLTLRGGGPGGGAARVLRLWIAT
ncbi:MAG TPA: hypothetical protein VEE83_04455, partial [Thermoplasmata archaeon]|nr:hypothetical protein [Thermoplasmata archaeon]